MFWKEGVNGTRHWLSPKKTRTGGGPKAVKGGNDSEKQTGVGGWTRR